MRRAISALFVLALAACATGYNTRGVVAVPLGTDLYRVEANLNQHSNQSMVQDYLLLRAAETALQAGAHGFTVVSNQDTTRQRTLMTGGGARTQVNAFGTATTTYTPPNLTQQEFPRGMMVISLVRGANRPQGYFSAQELERAIRPRVKID
jgi:hypothetical protein